MNLFNFFDRSIPLKNELPKILNIRNDLKPNSDDQFNAQILQNLQTFSKNELLSIDKKMLETNNIAKSVVDIFKHKYDEKNVANFVETFSSENPPSKPQELTILYNSIAFLCEVPNYLNKENFQNLTKALSICVKLSYPEHSIYMYNSIIEYVTNNKLFEWDLNEIQNVMKIYTENANLINNFFNTVSNLVIQILDSDHHYDINIKNAMISGLLELFKNSKSTKVDFASYLNIIEPYVCKFNIFALRMLWELLKYQEIFNSGGRRVLNALISSVVNNISKNSTMSIQHGINNGIHCINGRAHDSVFKSSFDGNFIPIDFDFYFDEDFFEKTFGEELNSVKIVGESLKEASMLAKGEFFNCFVISEDIISATVFLFLLSYLQIGERARFIGKLFHSFIFNDKEGVFGPTVISHDISMLRTYALSLFVDLNDHTMFNELIVKTEHFLVVCDLFTRIHLTFGKKFIVNSACAKKIENINRALINFQKSSINIPVSDAGVDKVKLSNTVRSAFLISLFDLVENGDQDLVSITLNISYEVSVCRAAVLAISRALPCLSDDSVRMVIDFANNIPDFAQYLVHDLSDYSRTNKMEKQIDMLIETLITATAKFLDEDSLFSLVKILSATSQKFVLKPEYAKDLCIYLTKVDCPRINNFLLTVVASESYYSGFLTFMRPSFIILLFSNATTELLKRIYLATDETQNNIYLHEEGIDDMLLSIIDTGKSLYKGIEMPFVIPEKFCRDVLEKVIPECTSKSTMRKVCECRNFDRTFEKILTTFSAGPSYRPFISTYDNKVTFQHSDSAFSSFFSIVMVIKVDRNKIRSADINKEFKVQIFKIEDRLKQNRLCLYLTYNNFNINITLESINSRNKSAVDLVDFTKPFDSYNDLWVPMVINVYNGKEAKVETTFLAHNDISRDNRTGAFPRINIGSGTIVVGESKPSKLFEGNDMVFGRLEYVSFYKKIMNHQNFKECLSNADIFNEHLIFSTKLSTKRSEKARNSIAIPDAAKNVSFINSLCTPSNLELFFNLRMFNVCKFILERSVISISNDFSLINSINSSEHKDYKLYTSIFSVCQPLLLNDEGTRFLNEVLLNISLWKDCIEKVTLHWSTLLFATIRNSEDIIQIFKNTLSLFNENYDKISQKARENIILFLSRLGFTLLSSDAIYLVCACIINATTTEKATMFMLLLFNIGRRIRTTKFNFAYAFFNTFMTDEDPKLYAETVCAMSSIYGGNFHKYVPILVEKFNSMQHKIEIFNELMKKVRKEPNIATFIIATKFQLQRTDEIKFILETETLEFGKGWFKDIAELVCNSDQGLMNLLIMILSSQCARIENDKERLTSIDKILFIFFKNFNWKQDELDPFYLFMSNYLANQNVIEADMKDIYFWCVSVVFFRYVGDAGNSSILCDDKELQETAKQLYGSVTEEFFTHSEKSKTNQRVIYEVSLDASGNVEGRSLVGSQDIMAHYQVPDDLNRLANFIEKRRANTKYFETAQEFVSFNNSVDNICNNLNKITERYIKDLNQLKENPELEISQDFQNRCNTYYKEAETNTENYSKSFFV